MERCESPVVVAEVISTVLLEQKDILGRSGWNEWNWLNGANFLIILPTIRARHRKSNKSYTFISIFLIWWIRWRQMWLSADFLKQNFEKILSKPCPLVEYRSKFTLPKRKLKSHNSNAAKTKKDQDSNCDFPYFSDHKAHLKSFHFLKNRKCAL